MPKFSYVATTPEGESTSGVQRAVNREELELALFERELTDIRITEKRGGLSTELLAPRIKREDVMHLSRQLSAFLQAGLPIVDAVQTLGTDARTSSLRRMLADIEDGLRSGDTLADGVERYRKVFPEYYRGIVRSAELSGELDTALRQLAGYLERDLEARRRITSATIYPAMICLMSVATVIVLATFVMPRFQVFFASLNAELPLPTRMLLAVTGFVAHWWFVILGVLGVLMLLAALVVRNPTGRYARDRLLLGLPVIGATIRCTLVERFCRVLSSMVSAGVALPEALRVSTNSLHNLVFRRSLGRVREAMLQGEGLAQPLAVSGVFPATAIQMMRVGEQTGTLDTQLDVTAGYYEGELDYRLKKVIALFEPAVIVVMGGIVGFVAVAMVSAMYGIFNQNITP
jgi:type IV pilus assembly protein PilC